MEYTKANRPVAQMLAPLAACREQALEYNSQSCYMILNIQRNIFNPCSIYPHDGILTHQSQAPVIS